MATSALGYQQGNLVFELSGWNVSEQYSNSQSFFKNGLFLEVRASAGKLVDVRDFAASINGKVESEKNGTRYEAIIMNDDSLYLFVRLPYQDKMYLLTMTGKPSQLNAAKTEMKKALDSVSFSAEEKVVVADWEKELKVPDELAFLAKHPIPWLWVVFWLVIVFLVWRKIRKRKGKK